MGKYVYSNHLPAISTFSIVAFNPATQEIGVAVQSKFLAVGAAVPWVAADAGAIATQSFANTSYGPKGLAMLKDGLHPAEVMKKLTANDTQADERQVGIVDLLGRSATYTGAKCFPYAGGIAGENFACQGNILAGEGVVRGLAETFAANAHLPFAERLVSCLEAAHAAGGDKRGMQSAALYIAKPNGGYGGFNDRYIDLRVDDAPDPIAELGRILKLQRLYFDRPRPEDLAALTGETLQEVKDLLAHSGYTPGAGTEYDEQTKSALYAYYMTENFDERWVDEPVIDVQVLQYMRRR